MTEQQNKTGIELLQNPAFADGMDGWIVGEPYTLLPKERAVRLTHKCNRWFETQQELSQSMKKTGAGQFSATCRLKGTAGVAVELTIKLQNKADNLYKAKYHQSSRIWLTDEYQAATVVFTADPQEYERVYFYWTTQNEEEFEMIVSDCSVKQIADYSTMALPELDKTLVRPARTSVGAIRWDAYFTTSKTPEEASVADQVARTLSYYPNQAPYFTRLREKTAYDVNLAFGSVYDEQGTTYELDNVFGGEDKTITIPYRYGVTWEEETQLALDAGLDYFAYLWYKTNDPMALPRKAHVAQNGCLPDGRQMKMCAILEYGRYHPAAREGRSDEAYIAAMEIEMKELFQAMAQDCYLSLENAKGAVPILYLYDTYRFPKEYVENIKSQAICFTNYLAKKNPARYHAICDLYVAGMTSSTLDSSSVLSARLLGLHAITRYSHSLYLNPQERETAPDAEKEAIERFEYNDFEKKNGHTKTCYSHSFETLSRYSDGVCANYEKFAGSIGFVPVATAGRIHVPRIRIGTRWCGDYGWQYTRIGTADEIALELKKRLQWVKAHPEATPANSVLIYAWNEHDEGGWICPSLKTDESGNIVTDENGAPVKDSSILDAIAPVLKERDSL